MKKLMIVSLAVLILAFGTAAFAASQQMGDKEVDASLAIGTAPATGWGTGMGFDIGAGMMMPQVDPNVQGRVNIGYMKWSQSFFGATVSFKRMPILVSGRYYIPMQQGLKAYVQGGLELSIDTARSSFHESFYGAE